MKLGPTADGSRLPSWYFWDREKDGLDPRRDVRVCDWGRSSGQVAVGALTLLALLVSLCIVSARLAAVYHRVNSAKSSQSAFKHSTSFRVLTLVVFGESALQILQFVLAIVSEVSWDMGGSLA